VNAEINLVTMDMFEWIELDEACENRYHLACVGERQPGG
jgi:hypothetical protein